MEHQLSCRTCEAVPPYQTYSCYSFDAMLLVALLAQLGLPGSAPDVHCSAVPEELS
jgi:hypothetical protein